MRVRKALFVACALTVCPLAHAQQLTQKDFPLVVTIEKVEDYNPHYTAAQDAEDARLGFPSPRMIVFDGNINGERYWRFQCQPEVSGREAIICDLIPTGEYRGRWVHDTSMLQIVSGSADNPTSRFLTVWVKGNTSIPSDDPVSNVSPYDFDVKVPNGRLLSYYPYLIHVYGSVTLHLPVGTSPSSTICSQSTWNPIQTTVKCTTRPPVEISRGYVDVDFSVREKRTSMHCDVKWRWSHCSTLEPGLYYARIEKDRLVVLAHQDNGQPKELGYEVMIPKAKQVGSPIK